MPRAPGLDSDSCARVADTLYLSINLTLVFGFLLALLLMVDQRRVG